MARIVLPVMVAALLFSFGCISQNVGGSRHDLKIANITGGLVDRNLISYYQNLSQLNASAGDPPLDFSPHLEQSRRLMRVIARRISGDLQDIYKDSADVAEQTYLVIGRSSSGVVVYVARLQSIGPDGSYTRLKGLIYHFKGGDEQFVTVTSSDY